MCNVQLKADPYAFEAQMRPETASCVVRLPPKAEPNAQLRQANNFDAPISIYEVHLASWRRHTDNNFWLSYQDLATQLAEYANEMGFTHIELLPINEHPFDGSWGYQPLGLYAPTRRFGTPQDFRCFVDTLHEAGINVLLDWVPGHFPTDAYGLAQFHGTALYEYADPKRPHSQSKCNKVTHWPDPDKITVLALLEIPLHAGKTSDSQRAVLHRKTAW